MIQLVGSIILASLFNLQADSRVFAPGTATCNTISSPLWKKLYLATSCRSRKAATSLLWARAQAES